MVIWKQPEAHTRLRVYVATMDQYHSKERFSTKPTPWPLVRKRNIPTERPPPVDEI
jgi:hypothetical protein